MKKALFILLLNVVAFTTYAQKGFLRGKILDKEFGDGLIGATVSKQGTTIGTAADFDGNYSLALDVGTHTVVFQFVSYQTVTISDVIITEGEITKLDIEMGSASTELEEVVITAAVVKDSDIAILTVQKKSANLVDGISSQAFKKTGDSNLSSAMKRVTGVSVQGGRYVYVRGLGDRYTRTTLNGMSIPGLDPDRNDVQIDIFPTSILENVVVYKTFTPDLAGDFTGGTVDVQTKSFPEEKTTTVSGGIGFNSDMHFNKDYVTYEGGNTDFLGFDDGTRQLPLHRETIIPNEVTNLPQLETVTRSFNPTLATENKRSFMNTSFSFNHGNQIDKERVTIGYGAILNYQNKYEYYENAEFGFYIKDPDPTVNRLFTNKISRGRLGRNNVLWSGLLSGAIKFDNHEFSTSILRTQNGVSEATNRLNEDLEETGQKIQDNILTYTQRSITNNITSGKHNFEKIRIDWSNSLTLARISDPDFRITSIAQVPGNEGEITYTTDGGDGGNVARFYRDLKETNENFKVDITYPFGEKNKLKFGGAGLLKWREFTTDNYIVNRTNNAGDITADPDFLLESENIWDPISQQGTYISGNFEAANSYDSRSSVYSAYGMADMSLTPKLRAIYGLRIETAKMFYTGQNNFGTVVYDDEETLNTTDFLPSANLVYALNENTNLRASYGRTLARPSFKEKSIAQILDPITGVFFNGNIDLEQTSINNYDLRWENFFGRGEMISVSAFYKDFQGHIELTTFESAPSQVTPVNVGSSYVFGFELEVRKNIDIVEGLAVGTNISITKSEVDMTEISVGGRSQHESILANAREGEVVETTREMAGQAPYLINGFINYADNEGKNNVNLSYNVQGENISVVGVGNIPNRYNAPFHSLNLNASRNIGVDNKSRITVGVNNILGSKRKEIYKSYQAEDRVFSLLQPGRTFNVKYSYTF